MACCNFPNGCLIFVLNWDLIKAFCQIQNGNESRRCHLFQKLFYPRHSVGIWNCHIVQMSVLAEKWNSPGDFFGLRNMAAIHGAVELSRIPAANIKSSSFSKAACQALECCRH